MQYAASQDLKAALPPAASKGQRWPEAGAAKAEAGAGARSGYRACPAVGSGQWAVAGACVCVCCELSGAQLSLPWLATEPLRPRLLCHLEMDRSIALSLLWLLVLCANQHLRSTSARTLKRGDTLPWTLVRPVNAVASGFACFALLSGRGRPHPHSLGPCHDLEFRLYKTRAATCMLHGLCAYLMILSSANVKTCGANMLHFHSFSGNQEDEIEQQDWT